MTDDVSEKHAALVRRLYKRTIENSIVWELNEARNPTARVGNYSIVLYDGRANGNPTEYMSLNTVMDEHIETVTDDDISEFQTLIDGQDTFWELMTDMRLRAFRKAVGADKAVDDILTQLGEDF